MKVYGYSKCSTTKKALKWLKDQGYQVSFIDNKEHNFTVEEVRTLYLQSHLPIQKLFNTSGLVYRELNLKEQLKAMSEDEKLSVLASDGMLLKRPMLVLETTVLVGFNEDEWRQHLK